MAGETSAHPPLPPTEEDERLDWLRLLRSRRVGIATFARLLREHGSARAALKALPGIARTAGVPDYAPCPEGVALAEYRRGTAQGARLILQGDPAYPPLLALLPDAPPLLWALGDLALLSRPTVALVGARNASSLGLRMARSLSEGLGQAGFVVASGLARGVDAAAHLAALPTGTVAVMAGGVDHVYPTENASLAADIAARGLRLSEHPMGLEPQARHFPARNRIVAGLALGVVVVEAAERSGSLITARTAADQGREVLAVPGHPLDPRAAGCNLLLRDGATLVRHPEDIEEALVSALARWHQMREVAGVRSAAQHPHPRARAEAGARPAHASRADPRPNSAEPASGHRTEALLEQRAHQGSLLGASGQDRELGYAHLAPGDREGPPDLGKAATDPPRRRGFTPDPSEASSSLNSTGNGPAGAPSTFGSAPSRLDTDSDRAEDLPPTGGAQRPGSSTRPPGNIAPDRGLAPSGDQALDEHAIGQAKAARGACDPRPAATEAASALTPADPGPHVLAIAASPSTTRPPSSATPAPSRRPPDTASPPDLRSRILDRLGPSPVAEDQLIRDLGEGVATVAPALTDLELEGRVIRQPGGLLSLAA